MFPYPVLRYSAEPKITLTQLKKGPLIEDVDTSKIAQWMEQKQIGAMMEGDDLYTHHRSKIISKPYIVYYQGNIDLLYRPKLGIVGSRKITKYGEQVTKDLFAQLEGKEVVTISGGAEGIDELCHTLSIQAGIPTICVLGGGLAYYLSHARRGLFERIVQAGGLIISEFRLKEQPAPYTFPQRNRIIAGLSDWLFVPCAAEKSGSLITVKDALAMRVPVYGVPGSIYEDGHHGVNQAIANGDITAIRDCKIFVDTLSLKEQGNIHKDINGLVNPILTPEQSCVYTRLCQQGSEAIEHIAQAVEQEILTVSMILTELEMEDLVYEERPGVWKSKR